MAQLTSQLLGLSPVIILLKKFQIEDDLAYEMVVKIRMGVYLNYHPKIQME